MSWRLFSIHMECIQFHLNFFQFHMNACMYPRCEVRIEFYLNKKMVAFTWSERIQFQLNQIKVNKYERWAWCVKNMWNVIEYGNWKFPYLQLHKWLEYCVFVICFAWSIDWYRIVWNISFNSHRAKVPFAVNMLPIAKSMGENPICVRCGNAISIFQWNDDDWMRWTISFNPQQSMVSLSLEMTFTYIDDWQRESITQQQQTPRQHAEMNEIPIFQ